MDTRYVVIMIVAHLIEAERRFQRARRAFRVATFMGDEVGRLRWSREMFAAFVEVEDYKNLLGIA